MNTERFDFCEFFEPLDIGETFKLLGIDFKKEDYFKASCGDYTFEYDSGDKTLTKSSKGM